MAIITNQDDDANKKIKSSDRRKRAAAAKRMKNAEPGGWKSLSVEDRQFLAEAPSSDDTPPPSDVASDVAYSEVPSRPYAE